MPNIESLPKWAQQEIKNLRRDRDAANKALETASGGTPLDEAHVIVHYSAREYPLQLPAHTEVRFVLTPSEGRKIPECVQVNVMTDRNGERYLRILGDRSVSLTPSSANGLELRLL